ncbi:hypothetical protein GW756_05115 [bacterium]|nr:hypothetical protein [bacterium]NCQ55758.1 hypothetical protein [Candidatus Parcubacteria bacterium]NCS67707.1 hypothetical protein [Candidatus Peregrinibacteria bacterium]NCS96721.1 hypothetical protein [bacterium]
MFSFDLRFPLSDDELRDLAGDIELKESHALTGMPVIEADLFEEGGESMKSLTEMFAVLVKKYGGPNTFLATNVAQLILEMKTVSADSDAYVLAQLRVVLMVQRVRELKSNSWRAALEV